MYGFLITQNYIPRRTLLDTPKMLGFDSVQMWYSPLPKFENDRLFFEDKEKIVLLDGVIFNKRELLEQAGSTDWKTVFEALYRKAPHDFIRELRGSFCGVVLEKSSGALLAFTNQSGEKTVYYTRQKEFMVIASHNNLLTDILAQQGTSVEPDIQSCRELLCAGSILHGKTPFAGVHRLMAGKLLLAGNDTCAEQRYHMFRNVPEHELTLEECVEEYDKRFRQAVDRMFSKNLEYGYQAECDLSGGLDSRMATWVAHDLGYLDVLNICYCMRGNIDNTTSENIANDFGNEYLFLQMDGGEILLDVDEVIEKFGGQVSYLICTGANRAMKQIANRKIGLCVTGLLGELVNAYWVEGETHTPPKYTSGRYSDFLSLEIPGEYEEDYENFEQMNLYEYSTLLFMSSSLVRQQQCEVTSPFVDVDLLDFAYRIPLKYRQKYFFTQTWMVTKYPESAKYVWQTYRMPVDKHYFHQFYLPKLIDDVRTFFVRCVNKVGRELRLPIQISLKSEMNPFDLWYRTNPKLQQFVAGYYTENISRVQNVKLKEDVMAMYEKGNARDKLQVINLLAVFKRYFHE